MKTFLTFSKKEIRDIVISTVVLALAFGGFNMESFLTALFILTFAFIFHELGHRTMARKFGAFAEYRMWPMGLALALVSSFFGFIFAAPGAVYISPLVRKGFAWSVHSLSGKEYGLIALAGPAVNIVLGFIFIGSMVLIPSYAWLFYAGARICFFLALFNMFPVPPLDGSKIVRWSWGVWGVTIVIAVIGYTLLGMI